MRVDHGAQFWDFHLNNPGVYCELVELAHELRKKGYRKCGIGMLFEVLRWQRMLKTIDASSDFKLNNNYRSRYARLIMAKEPDLREFFELRELRS